MTDIKQALKEEIKDLEAQLKRAQKALEAYTPDAAPKASKAPRTNGSSATSATQAATGQTTPGNLPDRIVAYTAANGAKTPDELSAALNAPLGQVRTTCSRLVKAGRLEKLEGDGTTRYLEMREPHDSKKEPEVAGGNPFEGAN
jgi:hypothetical protein